jgi:hypothetical protein
MLMVNTSAWWAPGIRTSKTVRFPGGHGRISPVDPRNIAATACAVLTQPGHQGRAYDVTGPQLLTIAEMVAILSGVLGQDIRYLDVPETEAGAWMAQSGAPPTVVAALLETLAGIRANKFAYIADTVARLTGHPGRTYQTWCQEHADGFQPPTDQMPQLQQRRPRPRNRRDRRPAARHIGPADATLYVNELPCQTTYQGETWMLG